MNIQERIQEVIDTLYNGNKRLFANSVGISPTTLENVVGIRQGNPSYLLLYKICSNANINTHWLITGEGEMAKTNFATETTGESDSINKYLQTMLETKDRLLMEQAEELGRLREQVRQLEIEKTPLEYNAEDADISYTSQVG